MTLQSRDAAQGCFVAKTVTRAEMPRYFLHVTYGARTYRDHEGVELPDLEAAWDYAVSDARDLMCQNADDFQDPVGWEIQVCDQAGRELLALPFADAMRGNAGRSQKRR